MKQQTLAMAMDQNDLYEKYREPTRRDTFLVQMEALVPWTELCSVIEPHYPKAGNGRSPVGLERMLRMYFVQHWSTELSVGMEASTTTLASNASERFRRGRVLIFSAPVISGSVLAHRSNFSTSSGVQFRGATSLARITSSFPQGSSGQEPGH